MLIYMRREDVLMMLIYVHVNELAAARVAVAVQNTFG